MASSLGSSADPDSRSPQLSPPVPPAEPTGDEYAVVQLRFESLSFAYFCFFATLAWFQVYRLLIRAGWFWGAVGGMVLASLGTLNAVRAWRKTRTFPALVALLLDGGLLAAMAVPIAAFFTVYLLL